LSRLKGAIASIPKHKLLEGTVLEVLGNKMSIRLANNGRILVGIPYLGGPCSTGAAVKIDYSSGQPVAYAIGEAYVAPIVKKTIANSSKGSTSEPGRISPAEHSFLAHTDVPDAYTDQALRLVAVKADESGLEFRDAAANAIITSAIVLNDVSQGVLVSYPATVQGLDEANASAQSGDTIYLPAATIEGDHTLKSGVAYLGQFVKSVTFTGKLTLEAGSKLYNAAVERSANDSSEVVAVQGPVDGGAILDYCILRAVQNGSGDAIAVKVNSSSGILYIPRCSVEGLSNGGSGYAIYRGEGNACQIKAYWCSLEGSTAVANTNSDIFTYGCTYDTPTTHGVTMEGDGAVGGGGSPDPQFVVDGVLYAPVTGVSGVYVAPRGAALDEVLVYLNDSGSSGNTVVDVHRNGISIFDTPPVIAAGGVGVAQVFTPVDTLCEALDIYTVDIDQAATGAKGLTVILGFSSSSGGGSGGANALSELSDVALSAPAVDDVLSYNGSQWTNIPGNGEKARFAATLSGTHTPTNNTWGLIGFLTEVFDQGGYYDNTAGNYKWTPPAGAVMVTLLAEWSNPNANGQSIAIYKNGSALQTLTHRVATAYNHGHQLVVIDEADGDDYYQAYAWRWDGSGAIASNNGTRFSGVSL
jgi:hypothetical protein